MVNKNITEQILQVDEIVEGNKETKENNSNLIIDIDKDSNVELICERLRKDSQKFDYIQLKTIRLCNPWQVMQFISKMVFMQNQDVIGMHT